MIPAAKINAIVPYFGGKRTLAQEIVAELGPHAAYWEPTEKTYLSAGAPNQLQVKVCSGRGRLHWGK